MQMQEIVQPAPSAKTYCGLNDKVKIIIDKWMFFLYTGQVLLMKRAGIAQSVEHFTRNEGVVGSSPISSL